MQIKHLIKSILYFPNNLFARLSFVCHRVSYGKGILVRGHIYIRNKGKICIHNDVQIISKGKGNPIGGEELTYFQVLPNAVLELKKGCALSNCAITCANRVVVGEHVFIGAGVRIYDTDFHSINPYVRTSDRDRFYVKTAPINLGDYCFIGAGSFVLKGVDIGTGSIVGAGSVVTKSIPPYEIWAGNPAKFVRKFRDDELKHLTYTGE